jgi:hypothetical protein
MSGAVSELRVAELRVTKLYPIPNVDALCNLGAPVSF